MLASPPLSSITAYWNVVFLFPTHPLSVFVLVNHPEICKFGIDHYDIRRTAVYTPPVLLYSYLGLSQVIEIGNLTVPRYLFNKLKHLLELFIGWSLLEWITFCPLTADLERFMLEFVFPQWF